MVGDDMRPFVSVIMPVRNERNTIARCIDAFLNQTYPRNSFELVIADRSDDGTREVLQRYERQYHGWLCLFDNPTGKIAEGYNIALSHARGTIVNGFIGHAYPASDYIERIVEALSRSDIDMVGGRVIPVPATGKRTAAGIAAALQSRFTIGSNAFTRQKECPVTSSHWMAVKRVLIDRVGGFNTRFTRGEDCDWYERMTAAGAISMYDPRIRSFYFPRDTLLKQFAIHVINGWYRVRLFCATGRGMRFRHLLPLLLLLLWSLALIVLNEPLAVIGGTIAVYGLILLVKSVKIARPAYRLFPIVVCAIFLIHLGHVLGMLFGFAAFTPGALLHLSRS